MGKDQINIAARPKNLREFGEIHWNINLSRSSTSMMKIKLCLPSPAPSCKDMFQLHHNQHMVNLAPRQFNISTTSSEFRLRPLATGLKQDNNSSSSTMEPRMIVLQTSYSEFVAGQSF
ncbi:hypothetical protein B0H13DRAFT_1871519 [Mycena leptocephala]|nr:hypothetical protein B0H13DRAFT_1871519 [Mycena leptocephala]